MRVNVWSLYKPDDENKKEKLEVFWIKKILKQYINDLKNYKNQIKQEQKK